MSTCKLVHSISLMIEYVSRLVWHFIAIIWLPHVYIHTHVSFFKCIKCIIIWLIASFRIFWKEKFNSHNYNMTARTTEVKRFMVKIQSILNWSNTSSFNIPKKGETNVRHMCNEYKVVQHTYIWVDMRSYITIHICGLCSFLLGQL